jgi:tetratricopeptide (TPR) repeat protein
MHAAGRMSREAREAYLLGRQRFESGDAEGAIAALARVAESCPRYADVHYLIGLAHERSGDLASATSSLERALALNPGYAECRLALASVYEQRGQFDRSRALAERPAPPPPRQPDGPVDATTRGKLANLHAALGDAYREAGDLREAVDAYRRALDRAPGFHDIRHRLGIALREAGLPSHAVAEFRRVLRANPSYLESAVQLGLTYYSLGRSDRALHEWEAVLERDPGRDDARMYLRMVQGARERSTGGGADTVELSDASGGADGSAEPDLTAPP